MELIVNLHLLSPEEGGRSTPIASGYRAGMFFEPDANGGNDGILTIRDGDTCAPGETCTGSIRPLRPDLLPQSVKQSASFELREGWRVVAKGLVMDVVRD